MAILVLDSIGAIGAPITVLCQQAGDDPLISIGGFSNAFAGNERSSVRAEKKQWSSLSTYVDTATKDAIKALIAKRRQITCNGELLSNVATVCAWSFGGARLVSGTILWEVKISGREV